MEFLSLRRPVSEARALERIYVATKVDKLGAAARKPALEAVKKMVGGGVVGFSAVSGEGREALWDSDPARRAVSAPARSGAARTRSRTWGGRGWRLVASAFALLVAASTRVGGPSWETRGPPAAVGDMQEAPAPGAGRPGPAPSAALARVPALLDAMTLDEKIGQMVMLDYTALASLDDIAAYSLGALMPRGDEAPADGSPQPWFDPRGRAAREVPREPAPHPAHPRDRRGSWQRQGRPGDRLSARHRTRLRARSRPGDGRRARDSPRGARHGLQHGLQPRRRRRARRALGPHLRELRGRPGAREPDGRSGRDRVPDHGDRRAIGPARMPEALRRRGGHVLGHRCSGRHRSGRGADPGGPDAGRALASIQGRGGRGRDGDHGVVQLVCRHQDVGERALADRRPQGRSPVLGVSSLGLRRDTTAPGEPPAAGRCGDQRGARHDR